MSFSELLERFTTAVVAGDGTGLAACFTADGVYHDYVYGTFRGRPEIARMLEQLWHRDAEDYRWDMLDPISDGSIGYANWLFSYTVKMPEFAGQRPVVCGASRFVFSDGLIESYTEWVNAGVTMVQLGLAPERMAKLFKRAAQELRSRPDIQSYLEP